MSERAQVYLYAGFMLFGVLISSIAQVMLKKASQREYNHFWEEYLNPRVIIAYAIFFSATLLSIYAYRVIPLSMGAVLEATGYLYIAFFGVVIFHERISFKKGIALLLIVAGTIVYAV